MAEEVSAYESRVGEMNEIEYWIAWNTVPGIGPRRFARLMQVFGSAKTAWHASPDSVRRSCRFNETILSHWQHVHRTVDPSELLEKLGRIGVHALIPGAPGYPAMLRHIPDPPAVLYIRGNPLPEPGPAIAIVGSRTPTPNGRLLAERFAGELAANGYAVISGFARGIDTAAHRGALKHNGKTVAVLGAGADVVYPRENAALFAQITQEGTILSEYFPGTPPHPGHFPVRNRIISGLSLGVLVIEAACDSGSLITVDHALEQGREVFAIPGTPGCTLSAGPNRLIKQGAKLVENVSDILEELNAGRIAVRFSREDLEGPGEAELWPVWKATSLLPRHIDEIIGICGLPPARVAAALLRLELDGWIRQLPGKLFYRIDQSEMNSIP